MVNYMRKEYNLMIGDSTAEKLKENWNSDYKIIILMQLREDLRSGTLKKLILQRKIQLKL